MITLDLPPQIETVLTEQANHAGLSVESYLIQHLEQLAMPKRQLGGGEHFLLSNLDRFDEPLDDFKDYV